MASHSTDRRKTGKGRLTSRFPALGRAVRAEWLKRITPSGRFGSRDGDFTFYDRMKVATYFDSDLVDLSRLSPHDA